MTTLLLIRHASNDYLKEGKLAGLIPGVHLNAQGQREADDLARRVNHIPLAAIYASPLERARETANAVAACQHLHAQIRPGLGEVDCGEWTGKPIKDLQTTELWKHIQTSPGTFQFPGGERMVDVQTRMVKAIEEIVAAHPREVIAIVSHADPIKAALAHYLKMDLNDFQRLVIGPASVTVLAFHEPGQGAVMIRMNDSTKLPAFKPEPEKKPDAKEEQKEKKMAEPNIVYDLNPVTHITAGVAGKPGKRTFYLQGRQAATIVTLTVEKEHLTAMSRGIDELLERLESGTKTLTVDAMQMELSQPVAPVFRVGQLGLGYDAENNLIVLIAYAIPEDENAETVDVVRFWATRDQMRALARHAAGIVAGGRPICVLCGRPIDPEGHFCPKRNGHGEKASLN